MGLALGTLWAPVCHHQHRSPSLVEPGPASCAAISTGCPTQALLWWQHVSGMPVPSLLETASLVLAENYNSSVGMAMAAEVQCQTGWGGLAGVWWCHPAEFEVLKGMLGSWQGRGGGGMLPTAWPRALPQESACLRHWATEPGENKTWPQSTASGNLGSEEDPIKPHHESLHQGLKNLVGERLFSMRGHASLCWPSWKCWSMKGSGVRDMVLCRDRQNVESVPMLVFYRG